jgi:hypothetical protein
MHVVAEWVHKIGVQPRTPAERRPSPGLWVGCGVS